MQLFSCAYTDKSLQSFPPINLSHMNSIGQNHSNYKLGVYQCLRLERLMSLTTRSKSNFSQSIFSLNRIKVLEKLFISQEESPSLAIISFVSRMHDYILVYFRIMPIRSGRRKQASTFRFFKSFSAGSPNALPPLRAGYPSPLRSACHPDSPSRTPDPQTRSCCCCADRRHRSDTPQSCPSHRYSSLPSPVGRLASHN
jgi:hypothetical protein